MQQYVNLLNYNYYPKHVVFAWFDFYNKIPDISINSVCLLESLLIIIGIIGLYLEIVHTFKIQHVSPTKSNPKIMRLMNLNEPNNN